MISESPSRNMPILIGSKGSDTIDHWPKRTPVFTTQARTAGLSEWCSPLCAPPEPAVTWNTGWRRPDSRPRYAPPRSAIFQRHRGRFLHLKRQLPLRVLRCLPHTTRLSVHGCFDGQASKKARGRKPRDEAARLSQAVVLWGFRSEFYGPDHRDCWYLGF